MIHLSKIHMKRTQWTWGAPSNNQEHCCFVKPVIQIQNDLLDQSNFLFFHIRSACAWTSNLSLDCQRESVALRNARKLILSASLFLSFPLFASFFGRTYETSGHASYPVFNVPLLCKDASSKLLCNFLLFFQSSGCYSFLYLFDAGHDHFLGFLCWLRWSFSAHWSTGTSNEVSWKLCLQNVLFL